jgi:lysophospholipase L1-like esterase
MTILSRRSFLAVGTAGAAALSQPRSWSVGSTDRELTWTDVEGWPIEGRAFAERKAPYDRLPARAEAIVRKEVWDLSRDSAGMVVRLQTTSPELHVRYRLTRDRLAMAHMPATGVSGVDLYGHDGARWRWIQVTRPGQQEVTAALFQDQPATETPRQFLLYLPLYNGIARLEVGVPAGATVAPMAARAADRKPIACYGTSILHGACASRPGMAWSAIVGRALDREVINLGFSGNGRMEAEVGEFLTELDPAVFVVDCLPNMSTTLVEERTAPLVQQLRARHAKTPILLVEDRTFGNAWFDGERRRTHDERRRALQNAFAGLRQGGDENLHLLAGGTLLGDDDEGTTDGSHPNDLGMFRQAQQLIAALRPLLGD